MVAERNPKPCMIRQYNLQVKLSLVVETFEAPLLDTEIRSGQFGTFLAQIKTKQNNQTKSCVKAMCSTGKISSACDEIRVEVRM